MKIIKGDLILKKDTVFDESITVQGNIKGWFNLRVVGNINAENIVVEDIFAEDIFAGNIVAGNINAEDIFAGNINAGNIVAGNINAGNIDVEDIFAGNINAGNIICETRIKKSKTSKTICKVYIKNKSKIEMKER